MLRAVASANDYGRRQAEQCSTAIASWFPGPRLVGWFNQVEAASAWQVMFCSHSGLLWRRLAKQANDGAGFLIVFVLEYTGRFERQEQHDSSSSNDSNLRSCE